MTQFLVLMALAAAQPDLPKAVQAQIERQRPGLGELRRETLALERRGEITYALVKLCGASRMTPGAMGYCGAGWECELVWARIVKGRVWDQRRYLVESCLKNVGPWKPCVVAGRAVRCQYHRLSPEGGEVVDFEYLLDEPAKMPRESAEVP